MKTYLDIIATILLGAIAGAAFAYAFLIACEREDENKPVYYYQLP